MADMDLHRLVQHHDGQLEGLNARMGHVEKTLTGHGTMLQNIERAVTKQDAKPTFNFGQTASTVRDLAILFSMVVGGIIWVTTSLFSPVVQTVNRNEQDVAKVRDDVAQVKEKIGWAVRVETGSVRR